MTKKSILYAVAGFIIGGAMSAVVLTIFDKPDQSLSLALSNQSMQALPSRSESMAGMTASLTTKTGDTFDQAFLIDMIKHHQAAVVMAKLATSRAKHDEIKTLSNDIISAQESEINQMKQWQTNWGYSEDRGLKRDVNQNDKNNSKMTAPNMQMNHL